MSVPNSLPRPPPPPPGAARNATDSRARRGGRRWIAGCDLSAPDCLCHAVSVCSVLLYPMIPQGDIFYVPLLMENYWMFYVDTFNLGMIFGVHSFVAMSGLAFVPRLYAAFVGHVHINFILHKFRFRF